MAMGYRCRQVFEFILAYADRNRAAPSYGVIADQFAMTRADVCATIRRLEHRGYLKRRDIGVRKNRGWHKPVIEVVETSPTTRGEKML